MSFQWIIYLYYLLILLLFIFGLNRVYLIYLYYRKKEPVDRPDLPLVKESYHPSITIQIPIYNESSVAKRIIKSIGEVDYPKHLITIQVLDDSTDHTLEIVSSAVNELRTKGLNAVVIHRHDRSGFKAGALANGLAQTRNDLILILDADFVPPSSFINNIIPYFRDPTVGLVQTRWSYLNRNYSSLTKGQAVLLDGHFSVSHMAKYGAGLFFNFNGTAGIWRRKAILESGGWQSDTLTEDLDLSYRAFLKGWKFVYLDDVDCPSELPIEITGLKTQQHRWTKGSIQVLKKNLLPLWRSHLDIRRKIIESIFMLQNISYLLMMMVSVLLPIVVLTRLNMPFHISWFFDIFMLSLSITSTFIFYYIAQNHSHINQLRKARYAIHVFLIGIGLTVTNAKAILEGLFSIKSTFKRTSKYGVIDGGSSNFPSYTSKAHRKIAVAEGSLFVYQAVLLAVIIQSSFATGLPFIILFLASYGYIFSLSVIQRMWRI